tara:strand:+ start:221 stop:655 length:435 start_codon:yes stop_codon:yes gene_type:complete
MKPFKHFITETNNSHTLNLRGLFVRKPWSQYLLNNSKIEETRTYSINKFKLNNEMLWLLETPKAKAVGIIQFHNETKYNTKDEFYSPEAIKKHLVQPNSKFEWIKPKYGWIVSKIVKLEIPFIPENYTKNRIFTSHIKATVEIS